MNQYPHADSHNRKLEGSIYIDLSDSGATWTTRECVVEFDEIDRPALVHLIPPYSEQLFGLSEQHRLLIGRQVDITLSNGSSLVATINAVTNVHSRRTETESYSTMDVRMILHIADQVWSQGKLTTFDQWQFQLLNAGCRFMDGSSDYSCGSDQFMVRDSTVFTLAGRKWTLIADYTHSHSNRTENDQRWLPALTSKLVTEYQEEDTFEGIEQIASDIEILLSFALCRLVEWTSVSYIREREIVRTIYRNVAPAALGQTYAINENYECGQLRNLIETAYKAFSADTKWYRRTLMLYVLSRTDTYLDIRMPLQNTLLERISARLLRNDTGAEIDKEINNRVNGEFETNLHGILSGLSPRWSKQHTRIILNRITEINSRPSFALYVQRAAITLSLWPPKANYLSKVRNVLLHSGEFQKEGRLGIVEYWQNFECFLTMVLLRMLNYRGPFYHIALGNEPKKLQDFMIGGNSKPPYAVGGRESLVRALAYHHWKERGKPEGDDWADWFWAQNNLPKWCESNS